LRKESLKRCKVKEILSLVVTLIEIVVTLIKIVVLSLFACDYNAVWDKLRGYLGEFSLLVGDVKMRVISLDKV